MTERTEVALPASLMAAIKAVTADESVPAVERFEAVLLITIGYGLYHPLATYHPTSLAIPDTQWNAIADMLQDLTGDPLGKVNYALDWMNVGPSGYKVTS